MPTRKRKTLLLSFLVAAAIIVAAIVVYIRQLNHAVYETTEINEMCIRDR